MPFSVLVQYRSERLSFSQDGTSITLAHLEGYIVSLLPISSKSACTKRVAGLPLLLLGGGRECPALPLSNTVLNASFSRRLVTRSRSFKTVLPCPFQYIVHGRLHHYKGSSVGSTWAEKCPALPPFYNNVLNARCSRRLFTHSRPRWTVLPCPGRKMPCFSLLLHNTVLNARCSRRMFTLSRSFWMVLMCPSDIPRAPAPRGRRRRRPSALVEWGQRNSHPALSRYRFERLSLRPVLHSHRSCSIRSSGVCTTGALGTCPCSWGIAPALVGRGQYTVVYTLLSSRTAFH